MVSTTCGYCGRLAHMKAASGLHISSGGLYGAAQQAVFECPECLRLNLATSPRQPGTRAQVLDAGAAEAAHWFGARWHPLPKEVRDFPEVPPHIGEAASEAALCLSVGAYRAVGSLARAVIEATAKDKGAEGGNLEKRIDALRARDHVRPHTAEQAHEIRHFGNDMAHGDFVDQITKEEAEEVLQLMVEVLDEVYQSPARLSKRKAARLAKKDQP